jgi:multiple sugar transport system substrate-binding protein
MLRSRVAVVSPPPGAHRAAGPAAPRTGRWTTRRGALARLALPAGAVAGLPLLAACGALPGSGGAPSQAQSALGPASLDVITRDEPIERGLMTQLYARFTEQYPQIKIEPVSPGASFNDKVAALLSGGTPPAVTGPWGTGGYRFWAVKGVVAELDSLIARDKYDLTDFYPKFVEATKMGAKRYALPMGVGIQVLAYNKEYFQRTGQTVPPGWADKSWNWDKYVTTARALTRDPDGAGAQWGSGNPWGDDRRIAYIFGGAWFDLKAYDTGKATTFLYEPNAVVEGIQFAADLINKHRVRPSAADVTRTAGTVLPFIAGRLGMESIATSSFARYSDASAPEWGVAAVPNPPSLQRRNWITADPWFGFKLTKSSDEQWALLKFLASKESMRIFPLQSTFVPPRPSLATEFKEYYVKLGKLAPADLDRTLEAMPTGWTVTSQSVPVFTDSWLQILKPEFDRVIAGEITARTMIERTRPGVEALMQSQP